MLEKVFACDFEYNNLNDVSQVGSANWTWLKKMPNEIPEMLLALQLKDGMIAQCVRC